MVRQVQPLRISKSTPTASPDKQVAMSRPLAEISSGSTRRNSPSYNQSTRVCVPVLVHSKVLTNVSLARKYYLRLSPLHSTRTLLPRHQPQNLHLMTSGPHARACRRRVMNLRAHQIAHSHLPLCLLSAVLALRSSNPQVGSRAARFSLSRTEMSTTQRSSP
jgi:hypothetical protein